MTRYRVDAYAAGGQRIASETIDTDGSDTALHHMAEQFPNAQHLRATPVLAASASRWGKQGTCDRCHDETTVLSDGHEWLCKRCTLCEPLTERNRSVYAATQNAES